MKKGATLSNCEKYRYKLWRIWDESKPSVMFMMCNPSTADAQIDDPTIRRCIGFAESWGFGGLYVGNLFAFRSKNPKDLLNTAHPVGEYNAQHIYQMLEKCSMIVTAWGNAKIVYKIVKKNPNYKPLNGIKAYYIDLSKDGTPKHPLYLKGDLEPKQYLIKSYFP
jgi:hypothetical protein